MKTITDRLALFAVIMFFAGYVSFAQKTAGAHNSKTTNSKVMKTYLIERDIPDAGKLTPGQLKSISQTACKVLKEMGPEIQWVQSYVTGDKIYCVYKAENEELIREHAKRGGFPANYILEISSVISPATAATR